MIAVEFFNIPWKHSRTWLRLGVVSLVLRFAIQSCSGHPDLIEQIAAVTQQLEQQGDSAALHLERADLFRRHGQFDAALADIVAAESLQTNVSRLRLERARILCDARKSAEAFEEIAPVLKSEPDHAEALFIRARCHAKLGCAEAAIADFTATIARSPAPGPDIYLERAKQQAALGKLAAAASGLDEAITNNTPLPSLQLAAIEYDRQRGAFDSALHRTDSFLARYPVKEPWLALRAEILAQAGRTQEAIQTFQQVIAGIEKYPIQRRNLDLTRQLESRAQQGLARIRSATSTPSKS